MKRDNRIYLEKIKIEFGDFIQLSECSLSKAVKRRQSVHEKTDGGKS